LTSEVLDKIAVLPGSRFESDTVVLPRFDFSYSRTTMLGTVTAPRFTVTTAEQGVVSRVALEPLNFVPLKPGFKAYPVWSRVIRSDGRGVVPNLTVHQTEGFAQIVFLREFQIL
jgi:hypothetical protein